MRKLHRLIYKSLHHLVVPKHFRCEPSCLQEEFLSTIRITPVLYAVKLLNAISIWTIVVRKFLKGQLYLNQEFH